MGISIQELSILINEPMSKYKVLGVEGNVVEINGVEYPAGVDHEIELTDEEAVTPLAESKIELLEDAEASEESSEEEETPTDETSEEEEETPADELE